MNNSIVRTEINGVEFFVLPSGEAGMSVSGLAILCGVGRQAVDNIVQSVSTSSCSKFLKCLCGKELTLSTSFAYKNVTVLRDDVCAIILEWYAFESQRTTKKARETYRKFAQAGIRLWIHKQANWEKAEVASKQQVEVFDKATAIFDNHEQRIAQLEAVAYLRRSGIEIRMAIAEVLGDPKRKHFSNVKIGKICGCCESTVRWFKKELNGEYRTNESTKKTTKIQVTIDVEVEGN